MDNIDYQLVLDMRNEIDRLAPIIDSVLTPTQSQTTYIGGNTSGHSARDYFFVDLIRTLQDISDSDGEQTEAELEYTMQWR